MAEEKSWFPNIGILSESSLLGIPAEMQDQLQREASKRMLIGGLLSGRPDIGFQSAIGVPNDYFARQQQILSVNQQDQRNRAVAAATLPTRLGATQSGEMNQLQALANQEGVPISEIDPLTIQGLASNRNLPREFNPAIFSKIATPLVAATDPTKLPQYLKDLRPTASQPGDIFRDVYTNKLTAVNPPALEKAQEYVYDSLGNITGVRNLEGRAQAVKEIATAEKGAAAQFEFQDVVENGQTVLRSKYDLSGVDKKAALDRANADVAGLQREISRTNPTETGRLAILNQELQKAQGQVTSLGGTSAPVSKVSAPEAAYANSWEQTAKSARTGYESSKKNAVALQSLQNIFNRPDFGTNAFTGYKSQIISVLQPLGLSTEQQNKFLTSATGARQALNDFAVNNVSELSGATSDRDIIFGKERFATLTDPTAATRYAIDLMEATNNRKKAYFDFVQNNRTNDVEQKWSQSPEGSASIFESAKMRKYLPSSVIQSGEYKGQTAYKMPNGEVKVFPK
jgi:hypothetical protein